MSTEKVQDKSIIMGQINGTIFNRNNMHYSNSRYYCVRDY